MRAGEVSHEERAAAALMALPEGSTLAGRSALWAYGARLVGPGEPVEVILPPASRARNRPGMVLRRDLLVPAERLRRPLGWATTPERTAFDLARLGPPVVSVPLLDALVRRTGVRRVAVTGVAACHPGARWVSRVGPALDLVDPGAESVRESQLRVVLVQAGLPRPRTQLVIRDADGRFVARTDLAWEEYLVAAEYDGAHHDERAQLVRDRARLNAMRRAGWTVLVIDAAQFARPDEVVDTVRAVLRSAGWPG
jgi:very-short-patch-repair endonuclease